MKKQWHARILSKSGKKVLAEEKFWLYGDAVDFLKDVTFDLNIELINVGKVEIVRIKTKPAKKPFNPNM